MNSGKCLPFTRRLISILFTISIFHSVLSLADNVQVAVVTAVQGKVQILRADNSTEDSEGSLLFVDKKYKYTNAKIGAQVKAGEILMTSGDGKVKIAYNNKDILIVGSSSAFVIPGDIDKSSAHQQPNLNYGRVRAVIDKEGPLAGINIKSPNTVTAVGGTDVYLQYNPVIQDTEVQVLQGEVEVKTLVPPIAKTSSSGLPLKIPKRLSLKVKVGELVHIVGTGDDNSVVMPAKPQDLARVQRETALSDKDKNAHDQ